MRIATTSEINQAIVCYENILNKIKVPKIRQLGTHYWFVMVCRIWARIYFLKKIEENNYEESN